MADEKRGTRRKQREIEGQHGLMAVKKILPVAFLALWLLAMALVWWIALAPGRWRTDAISYARMGVAEVNLGRGSASVNDVLIADDGRHFAVTAEGKTALTGKLQYGEACEIVYARNPIGIGPERLISLATAEDGELISAENAMAQIHEDRRAMIWLIGVPVALCVAVEVLIDRFGCRKERAKIAALKKQKAKYAARAARKQAERCRIAGDE